MIHSYRRLIPVLASGLLAACSSVGQPRGHAETKGETSVREQVIASERAFAKTMADRDFQGFTTLLSPEAIFFSGSSVEHGAAAIEAAWKPYFSGPTAPFSWAPDNVQVLPSGQLALSTGPVYVQGKEVSRFNSIWRREGAHTWRIVFDKGEAVCSAKP
ncbi:MAG TPA: nuclear transport factor 2 family protein [Steroidobacteraceae bacterium]